MRSNLVEEVDQTIFKNTLEFIVYVNFVFKSLSKCFFFGSIFDYSGPKCIYDKATPNTGLLLLLWVNLPHVRGKLYLVTG